MDVLTGGTLSSYVPFSGALDVKRQSLYLASDLGTSGVISKVALRLFNDSTASGYPNFEVKMASVTNTVLGSDFGANIAGGSTVLSAASFNIPAGMEAGDWIEIPLTTPFSYNGKDNLVVEMATDQGDAENLIRTSNSSTQYLDQNMQALRADTTGSPGNFQIDMRFTITR